MSRPVLRAGGLTRQRLSLLWCKESLCFAFHKGSIPAERFPYDAKFLFTTKSPLLQNPFCCKIPFAAKSLLLQNPSLLQKSSLLQIPFCCKGPEGFQRATGKPFGRLRRGEILRKTGKYKEGPFLAFHKKPVSCERFRPPAGGRGTFHHWKVPKGCRGRPKGACLMAAPGPPVAKLQCTASLAGARPAGFTSVPGRATVAFKVGFHFVKAKSLRDPRIRLWRKRGLAQLIPPPAPGHRSIPGVMARSRHGSATL